MPEPASDTFTQGTIARFDADSRAGRAVRDDGTEITFSASAVDPEIRLLRPGQRVHWKLKDDGTVGCITIATLPLHG